MNEVENQALNPKPQGFSGAEAPQIGLFCVVCFEGAQDVGCSVLGLHRRLETVQGFGGLGFRV